MRVNNVFISVNARSFSQQSEWWSKLLGRRWAREPMPSCREWDVAGCVLFQVLDNPVGANKKVVVTLHVDDLDAEIKRLATVGLEVPESIRVPGFASLRYVRFWDPEGNEVGLLDGS